MAEASPSEQKIGTLPGARLRRVTEYIHDNLDRTLTLRELGAVVYMSPYHFARLFKRSTGLPPHRFVMRQRIARARALLTAHDLPIGRIARSVGFRTSSHFTTVFRRVIGITPTAFRAGQGSCRILAGIVAGVEPFSAVVRHNDEGQSGRHAGKEENRWIERHG